MKAQHKKITRRRISAKDREFERLLRRASIYLKSQAAVELHSVRRKRVAAA
jgi:hypothetical protein